MRVPQRIACQGFSQELLPDALKDNNPLHIWLLAGGQWTKQ